MSHLSRHHIQLAILALAVAVSAGAQAQGAEPAAANAVSASDSLTGTTFSTPTSASSQAGASMGAYDLAGIGRRDSVQEMIFTAPVSGVPYRFDNGVFLFGSGVVGLGHTDNIEGLPSGGTSSSVFSLQPRLVAELKKSGDRYTLLYSGNFTRYTNSTADNFNTHELTLAGDNYFSARSRLGWSAGYISGSDPRGSTDRGISAEPDQWHAPTLRALYAYGAKGAQGRFEVEGGYQSKRYDNNRTYTAGSDVDIAGLSGRFFYRVMPRTSAVFELRRTDYSYALATSTNNNVDTRYLVGVTWEATAKTTGTFKIGHLRKNYSAANHADASGSTWEGSIRWSPLTYSVVDVITGRTANDSTGVGDFVTTTGTTVLWNHRWSSVLSSRVTLSNATADYAGSSRKDTTTTTGLGLFYELGGRYRAGLELLRAHRNSNQDALDFKRNTTLLSLEGTL